MTSVIHGPTGTRGAPVASVLAAAGTVVTALTRNADAVVPRPQVVGADCSSVEEQARGYRGAEGVFVRLPVGSEEDRLGPAYNIVAAVGEARPVFVLADVPAAIGALPGRGRHV